MLKVAGGTYLEACHVPEWYNVYGSGARAACAASWLSSGVELHTFVGPDCEPDLQALCDTFAVALHIHRAPQTISFRYFHALSTPTVWPLVHTLGAPQTLSVNGDAILRFGMLEGAAQVDGLRVVYDPQSVFDPRPFAENGSRARQLAVVLNRAEAHALTKEIEVDTMADGVLAIMGADIVVLKQGADGALLVTKTGTRERIEAFEAPAVFPIGSGDVFSAVFAALWAERELDPTSSARYASVAAAYYCSTRTLPVPRSESEILSLVPQLTPLPPKRRNGHRRTYLAGPFFGISQRWIVEEAKAALESQGLEVFSPLHDVGRGQAEIVVPADLKALDTVDVVFGIVDGLDPGTLFEIGYARSRDIPVVAFVEQTEGESLKLLTGSGCRIERDFTTAIYRTNWVARQT
jgi:nucleoside 2-deoxyribosyltransferase